MSIKRIFVSVYVDLITEIVLKYKFVLIIVCFVRAKKQKVHMDQ